MRHWHLAHGARSVSLCGAVNIELVRVSIWVRRCCHIENSDSIYFYLFSMYGPPRTPPPIYYHFPPQLSVLLAWIINVDYQIVFLVIHFPFQLFWLQILIKVSGFAMQYRFVRVFWRQPPGLMSMPINFIASRHSFLNLLFQYCRLRRERRVVCAIGLGLSLEHKNRLLNRLVWYGHIGFMLYACEFSTHTRTHFTNMPKQLGKLCVIDGSS